jgi:sugar lactone lactonase YvrE
VAQPGLGSIFLVRPQADGTLGVSTLIEDLRNPQGMAFHSSDDRLYLYVGESNQVSRFLIAPGAASAGEKTVIVPNLPDSSSPELGGPYRHELKNLVIGPDNKLYVDIASSTNADPIDISSNPVRSAIYQYDLDGKNGKIFARGIRNAEGLAFVPGTNELWAAVNETDDIRYPFGFKRALIDWTMKYRPAWREERLVFIRATRLQQPEGQALAEITEP